jgi:membrane protease YdiL (CAAX protease family)
MPNLAHLKILDVIDLLLMLIGGIILAAEIAWHMRGQSRDPLAGSPLRVNVLSPTWVWLALMVYLLSGFIGIGVAKIYHPGGVAADVDLWRTIIGGNIAQLMVIAAMLWIASQAFTAGLRGFGIGRQPFDRDLVTAVRGLLVSFCLCNLIVWATEAVFHLFAPRFELPPHSVFTTLSMPTTPSFVRFNAILGAVLLAPVGEELLFRGILQSGFRKLLPPRSHSLYHRWIAIVCVATLFGLMHLTTPQHVPALIVLGILLGILYERTGSILAPIYLHVLFNCKSLAWHYLG